MSVMVIVRTVRVRHAVNSRGWKLILRPLLWREGWYVRVRNRCIKSDIPKFAVPGDEQVP
jgi:hypothetical protein